jgi:hypothetical protein
MQIERKIDDVSDIIKSKLSKTMEEDFGVNLKRIDISSIELDQSHDHYFQLKKITIDQTSKKIEATTDIEITNMSEMARINRRGAELGVEGQNFAVHQLNQQTEVLKTVSKNLGQMSNINLGSGGGFNPAGMMFGMGVGSGLSNQLGGMMNTFGQTPPPVPSPTLSFFVAINGQQSGPFTVDQLQAMSSTNQFTRSHYVWKAGMPNWLLAIDVPELAVIFQAVPPPPPII